MPGEQSAPPVEGKIGEGAAGLRFISRLALVCVAGALGLAQPWNRVLPISHEASLLAVLLAILAGAILGRWLLAPAMIEQATLLAVELPGQVERLRSWFEQLPGLRRLAANLPPAQACSATQAS